MSVLGSIISAFPNIAGSLNGSQSANGSEMSGGGSSYGYNTAKSINRAQSSGYSNTYGTDASNRAANAAAVANEYSMKNLSKVMQYNAMEAQKQRDWEERMANTIYTRSVANMREAGINPILAASMGLSGASVGSGATASVAQPQTFMGQTFADTNSANQAWSTGDSYSHGENQSSYGYNGSSWGNSESGLATGLKQMQEYIGNAIDAFASSKTVKEATEGMEKIGTDLSKTMANHSNTYNEEHAKDGIEWLGAKFEEYLSKGGLTDKNWKNLNTNSEMYQAIRHWMDDGWDGLAPYEKEEVKKAINQGYVSEKDRKNYLNNK